MSDRDELIQAADDLVPLFQGQQMILRDLLSHDSEVISQIVGYDIGEDVMVGLREAFNAEVEDPNPQVRIVLLAKLETQGFKDGDLDEWEDEIEGDPEKLFAEFSPFGKLYDVEVHDVQVFEV